MSEVGFVALRTMCEVKLIILDIKLMPRLTATTTTTKSFIILKRYDVDWLWISTVMLLVVGSGCLILAV
jgi:hypothetical protein